jgi:hypothetical protein
MRRSSRSTHRRRPLVVSAQPKPANPSCAASHLGRFYSLKEALRCRQNPSSLHDAFYFLTHDDNFALNKIAKFGEHCAVKGCNTEVSILPIPLLTLVSLHQIIDVSLSSLGFVLALIFLGMLFKA